MNNVSLFYDVFVSYHDTEQPWVEWYLLPQLHAADFRVARAEQVVALSEPFWVSIERAVQQSRFVLAVVTAEWLANEWSAFERLLKRTLGADKRQERMLVLLREPVELPELLHNVHVPLFDFRHEEQWKPSMMQVILALGTPLQEQQPAAQPALSPPAKPPVQANVSTWKLLKHKFLPRK